jgi:hypothetical protein
LKAQVVTPAELDDNIDGDAQIDATIVRTPSTWRRGRKKGSTSPKRRHAKASDAPAAG